jgi:hypothetical protein
LFEVHELVLQCTFLLLEQPVVDDVAVQQMLALTLNGSQFLRLLALVLRLAIDVPFQLPLRIRQFVLLDEGWTRSRRRK